MKPKEIANQCSLHLGRIEPRITRTVEMLREWAGIGWGQGGSSGRSTGIHRPVEALVARLVDAQREDPEHFVRDKFARDHAAVHEDLTLAETDLFRVREICKVAALLEAELNERLTSAEAALRRVDGIVDRDNPLPRDEATGKVVVAAPDGCAPCAAIKDPETGRDHENGFQEIHTRRPRPSNLDGPKIPVCQWHARFIEQYGEEPAEALVRWHLDHPGARTPRVMIQDHHAEAWSRAQSIARGHALGRTRLDLRESA